MSVRRLSSVLVACAVVLVVVPPPSILAAGRVAAPPPGADDLESVRVRIAELEDRALAARARGRAAEAAEPLAEAVELAIRLVSDSADPADSGPDGGGGGRDAFAVASAESLLLLFDATIRQADAFASGRERLRPWLALPDLHPLLEARLRFLEARYAHAAGDGPDGFALGTKLGFLTDWQILGPFDNEQGSGFGLALPPETGFDPTAVYEGKAREVKWRTLPPHGRGYLALEGLFDPSEHVLVYLTTVLSLERATDVAFRLGTADGVEVFVDGHSVFRHDARRGAALDQDAFGIRLEAGDHVVLVKIGERTGSFGSTVRVTAPDGAPLEGWTQDASTPRLEAATHAIDGRLGAGGNAAEGPLAVPAAVDVLHAPAALRSLVTSDGSERSPALRLPFVARGPAVNGVPFEARLARRAAAAFLLLDIDDPRERTAERLARRAVELAPQDPHALYLLASAVSPPIKMRPEIEENARREHLLAVLELEPEHAEAALDLAAHYLGAIEIPDRAIAASSIKDPPRTDRIARSSDGS